MYEQLAHLLISGQLAPGDQLSLRKIASRLGVSIMPARDAVTRLTTEGALEVDPNRSVRVPQLTDAQFADLTRVRIAVEGFAASEAAQNKTDTDLADIRAAETALREELARDIADPVKVISLNQAFHFAVYRAAQSEFTFEIIKGLWLKAGPIINLDLRESRERMHSGGIQERHKAIVCAIADGHPDQAQQAIGHDIQSAADFILESRKPN